MATLLLTESARPSLMWQEHCQQPMLQPSMYSKNSKSEYATSSRKQCLILERAQALDYGKADASKALQKHWLLTF